MKHCPECNKNYADPTLSYCLNDGAPLIFGAAVQESETAVFADLPSEAPTRQVDPHTTAPTESWNVPHAPDNNSPLKKYLLIAGVLVVAIIIMSALGYRYLATANAKQIESVAILPFENSSGDANLDYLSDGLSESLIDRLSQLPQLKVISRNSSFKYRGPSVDIKEVAAKLGVRAVVLGKVARVGDNLMVRVEMIDVPEDRQIWSEQYQVKASDVLMVQREIVQQASENLRSKLTGEQERRLTRPDTTDPQAYEMLLKARFFRHGIELGPMPSCR